MSKTVLCLSYQFSPSLPRPRLLNPPTSSPPSLNQNGRARALAARQESVPGAREPGREGEASREERRGGRESKVAGDWLSRVAGARSLRLLSALLQRRSGRRLRAPSGPIRSHPAPAGVAAIGQSLVTKRDKGRRGERKEEEEKKKRKKESANGGY